MARPLVRWTVGDCNEDGLAVLAESLWRARLAFGADFDYLVCSNAQQFRSQVIELASAYDIEVIEPSWGDYPLPPHTCPPGPRGRLGSFWKMCPPRVRLDAHEIILDNDVIIRRLPQAIDAFLSGNRPLMATEPCLPYSKYYRFAPPDPSLNSGVIGLPPGLDFGAELLRTWRACDAMAPLLSPDEQGLIGVTLGRLDVIRLSHEEVRPLLRGGVLVNPVYEIVDQEGYPARKFAEQHYELGPLDGYAGLHFCEINRLPMDDHAHHVPYHVYRTGKLL